MKTPIFFFFSFLPFAFLFCVHAQRAHVPRVCRSNAFRFVARIHGSVYALRAEEEKRKKPATIKLPLVMVRAVLILPSTQRASLFSRNEKKGRENYGTFARK